MKKKIVAILCATVMAFGLIGCNKQIFDIQYSFNYAIIQLPNGEIVEGKVDSWKDYEIYYDEETSEYNCYGYVVEVDW